MNENYVNNILVESYSLPSGARAMFDFYATELLWDRSVNFQTWGKPPLPERVQDKIVWLMEKISDDLSVALASEAREAIFDELRQCEDDEGLIKTDGVVAAWLKQDENKKLAAVLLTKNDRVEFPMRSRDLFDALAGERPIGVWSDPI